MISKKTAEEVLEVALSKGGDFAEIFSEYTYIDNLHLSQNKILPPQNRLISGTSIRIFDKNFVAHSITCDNTKEGLLKCAKMLSEIFKDNNFNHSKINLTNQVKYNIFENQYLDYKSKLIDKSYFMRDINNMVFNNSKFINNVNIYLTEKEQHILIANSCGLFTADTRKNFKLTIHSIASDLNNFSDSELTVGCSNNWSNIHKLDLDELCTKSAKFAVDELKADYCPYGYMPIIISEGLGGALFHEVCGHPLEANSLLNGNSIFADKLGLKVANSKLTVIDSGKLIEGSITQNIDDEGMESRRNVLIENGILKSYMIDKLNGRILNMSPTGNARRESYMFLPTARMTNTFILPGEDDNVEIIESTKRGIFITGINGGSINSTTGEFSLYVFGVFLIEKGKIIKPLKKTIIAGLCNEVLLKIDRIGQNLSYGQCGCNSISGTLDVGVGQPTIRINEMLVGGK